MPQVFYKYMTYSTAKIVLTNQTLRWSTPATLNDPYDIQFDLQINFDRDEVLEQALEKLWKVFTGEMTGHPKNKLSLVINDLRPFLIEMPKDLFFKKMEIGIKKAFDELDKNIVQTH